MVACPLPVDHLGEQELLECLAVGKHAGVLELWGKGRHGAPLGHGDLVEGLAVSPNHTLDNHIAVDEVGTDPGRIEDRVGIVEEHDTDNVVANVTLLVDLCICMQVCVCECVCLLYTSPSPRDATLSRMPSSA